MAIKNLDEAAQVVKLYTDLKNAQAYAKQWADTVISIQKQLAAMQEFTQNVSPAELEYVNDSMAVSDVYSKAIPTPPDAVVPVV